MNEECTVTVCHSCCIVISYSDVSHVNEAQAEHIGVFEEEYGPLSHKEQRDNEQFKCEACEMQFHDDTAHIYATPDYFKNQSSGDETAHYRGM